MISVSIISDVVTLILQNGLSFFTLNFYLHKRFYAIINSCVNSLNIIYNSTIYTEKKLKTSNMLKDRIRTTIFPELSTQELIELSFNLNLSEVVNLLEKIDTLINLKMFLLNFH